MPTVKVSLSSGRAISGEVVEFGGWPTLQFMDDVSDAIAKLIGDAPSTGSSRIVITVNRDRARI